MTLSPEMPCSEGVADMVDGDKLVPFMRLFYGSPSTFLWEDDEGTVHHVRQGEGGEQGDWVCIGLWSQ